MPRGVPRAKEQDVLPPETLHDRALKDAGDAPDEYNIEVVRDFYGSIDVLHLNKRDEKYQYRWLNQDPNNLSIKTGNVLHQKGGWQLVPRTHLEKIGISDREISPDGLYRRGQLILAFMPKDLFKEKEAEKVRRANRPMDAINRLIKDGDPDNSELANPSWSQKGIQTQKQLGMR